MNQSIVESDLSLRFRGAKGSLFVPYFSLGDPNYDLSVRWASAIIRGGGDVLELGVPFSDPVADGPVIQRAFKRAFENPFSWDQIFETTRAIKDANPETPLVYLTYFNPIYQLGIGVFLKRAEDAGVAGLIIPDLPFDSPESEILFAQAKKHRIDLIHLVTPATEKSRIKKMKKNSSGFVYYVTSYGVTGERSDFSTDVEERVAWVREEMGLPVCAGFGISNAEQARRFAKFADGVIIGSSIQRIIEENQNDPDRCCKLLEDFSRSIRESMD